MKNLIALVFTALVAGLSACNSDAVEAERAEMARQDSIAVAEKALADSLANSVAHAAEKQLLDSVALVLQKTEESTLLLKEEKKNSRRDI